MILLLNGALGIGKSSVARLLTREVPGSAVYNPEFVGLVLQKISRLAGQPVSDFQDLKSWRTLTVAGIRFLSMRYRNVIVPMAFSNVQYLDEVRAGIRHFEPGVLHFCLVAPVEIVHERLRQRGALPGRNAWEFRRAAECCVAHAQGAFAIHIDAATTSADAIARDLSGLIRDTDRHLA